MTFRFFILMMVETKHASQISCCANLNHLYLFLNTYSIFSSPFFKPVSRPNVRHGYRRVITVFIRSKYVLFKQYVSQVRGGVWGVGLVGVRGDVRKRFDLIFFSFTSGTFFIFSSLICLSLFYPMSF